MEETEVTGKWNYRVIEVEGVFMIYECHYDLGTAPDSIPHSWTAKPIMPWGSTLKDLQVALRHMQVATERPVLKIKGDGDGLIEA